MKKCPMLCSDRTTKKNPFNPSRSRKFSSIFQATGLRRCIEEIVFSFTYPRLDMEVSVTTYFLVLFHLSRKLMSNNTFYVKAANI